MCCSFGGLKKSQHKRSHYNRNWTVFINRFNKNSLVYFDDPCFSTPIIWNYRPPHWTDTLELVFACMLSSGFIFFGSNWHYDWGLQYHAHMSWRLLTYLSWYTSNENGTRELSFRVDERIFILTAGILTSGYSKIGRIFNSLQIWPFWVCSLIKSNCEALLANSAYSSDSIELVDGTTACSGMVTVIVRENCMLIII